MIERKKLSMGMIGSGFMGRALSNAFLKAGRFLICHTN
jgi:pyrroline-5-carboxylate reductase